MHYIYINQPFYIFGFRCPGFRFVPGLELSVGTPLAHLLRRKAPPPEGAVGVLRGHHHERRLPEVHGPRAAPARQHHALPPSPGTEFTRIGWNCVESAILGTSWAKNCENRLFWGGLGTPRGLSLTTTLLQALRRIFCFPHPTRW